MIGSDLIYCADVVYPLFTTVTEALKRNPNSSFLISCSFDIGQVSNHL